MKSSLQGNAFCITDIFLVESTNQQPLRGEHCCFLRTSSMQYPRDKPVATLNNKV